MMKRVLLDANAILNAAFISKSWSRIAIEKLLQNKTTIFFGSSTILETKIEARKHCRDIEQYKKLMRCIEEYLYFIKAIQIHPSRNQIESTIPSHDHHVVQEAITANATILTSDAELWASSNLARRNALLPIQVIERLDGLTLSTTAFGVTPKIENGSIFARVAPGAWAGQIGYQVFPLIDFCTGQSLGYCVKTQAWKLDFPSGESLKLSCILKPMELVNVSISWKENKNILLRTSNTNHPAPMRLPREPNISFKSKMLIGARENCKLKWSGSIRHIVVNDRPISKELWRKLKNSPTLTPNPFDSDRLSEAVHGFLATTN